MKTSRLSRETARVTEALQINGPRRTRASVRNTAVRPANLPPATPMTDIEDVGQLASKTPNFPSRKRKRDAATQMPYKTEQAIRMSPRKAGLEIKENPDTTLESTKGGRIKRQPARESVGSDGGITVHAPPNWERMYELTAKMRKLNPAPVDTMGCETLAEEGLSERDRRFQTLIALMLSSQTKDTVTALTMRRLQTELPKPGLTLERIIEVEPDRLNELIWAVGFHNNKTKFIKRTAEILRDQYKGDIPDTIEGMTSLPGVGPKMAYLCMSSAWGRDEGIGVDVHVHRITNLWGWHNTKTPEETRAVLESWLPKDRWHDINHLLVGFGQTICAPIGRKCGDCTLNEHGLCPSAVTKKKVKLARSKKEPKVTVKEEGVTADGSKVKTEVTV